MTNKTNENVNVNINYTNNTNAKTITNTNIHTTINNQNKTTTNNQTNTYINNILLLIKKILIIMNYSGYPSQQNAANNSNIYDGYLQELG